jgi:cytochrome c oxidase assembly protein subunit 15
MFDRLCIFTVYRLNHNMEIQEFKRIFYMEWAHRMWGRAIGLAFVVPGLYFAARGYMTSAIRNRSLLIAGMIGVQGTFGWLMVKSGLDDEIVKRKDVPRVNHFWLSTHLGSAFLIYSAMLFTGLEILKQNRLLLQKVCIYHIN